MCPSIRRQREGRKGFSLLFAPPKSLLSLGKETDVTDEAREVSCDYSQFSPNPGSPGERRVARRAHWPEMPSPPLLLKAM